MEQNRSSLFQEILAAVRSGEWEVVGGMWIEPDLNLLSGESIARQIIYGQAYDRSRFGKITRVAWLPDTFGFTWHYPSYYYRRNRVFRHPKIPLERYH